MERAGEGSRVADPIHPLKLASLLLQYPRPEVAAAVRGLDLDELTPLSGRRRRCFEEHLAWHRGRALDELRRDYVETFDFAKRRSLHLTYHLHGDSRQRGLALLRLRQAYSAAGFEADPGELPDFLPLMLEFCALAPGEGSVLLDRHRAAIELIRESLHGDRSPYAPLLDVVIDGLPGLTGRQLARIRRLAADGPPTEQVGLEPFAPPEVMPRPGAPA